MSARPATPRAAWQGQEWRAIAILLTINTLAYLDRQILTLLVDPIRADLGVSDVEIGFLQGLGFTLFYALCGPFIGWAVDRWRRREIISAGVLVWSVGTTASGFADSYSSLLVARFAVGGGEAALLPAAYSLISDLFDKPRLGRALSVFSLGAIFGSSLSYAVGGALVTLVTRYSGADGGLIAGFEQWQLVFLMIGMVGIPLAFAPFAFRDPPRRKVLDEARTRDGADVSHFRRHWRFYACHILGFSLFCSVGAAISAWSATYMMRDHGWSVAQSGALLGLKNLVASGLGMLGAGWLADWLTRRGWSDAHLRLYLFALPVFAVAGLTAFLAKDMWLAFAGLAVVAIFTPFIAVAAAALQMATLPDQRGRVSAAFLLAYNLLGFGLGPAGVAYVSDHLFDGGDSLGAGMALAIAIVTPLVMLLMALGLRPMREAVADVARRTAPGPEEPHRAPDAPIGERA